MKARPVFDQDGYFYGLKFVCPGCAAGEGWRGTHILPVRWLPEGKSESPSVKDWPHWDFNGDMERPTLTPSVLSRQNREGMPFVCHSFITDGKIQFLMDSTHDLAGKDVNLPELADEPDTMP